MLRREPSQEGNLQSEGSAGLLALAADKTSSPSELVRLPTAYRAREVDLAAAVKLRIEHLNFFYGSRQVLFDVNLEIRERQITALIGPSGCGKTTFLRTLNRLNDLIPGSRIEGQIFLGEESLMSRRLNVIELRRRVGMVFQRPNPFPTSIFANVAYGLRIQGWPRAELSDRVEASLRQAALWDEVKDRLRASALSLSGGQQQRLCIARTLAVQPEIILMDEPCSALDPTSTLKIEELMQQLGTQYTVIIATHNLQQAARVSHHTAFFLNGRVIEHAPTQQMFTQPQQKETMDYITGRFG